MKSRGFLSPGLFTYDIFTFYTTLPHNLIKEKLTELIEQTCNREGSLYLACNDTNAFFTSEQSKRYKLWSCQKMCDALHYLLEYLFIRFGSKLYRQIVGIPMGTNCAPLVADFFLFCYERDFMLSLSDNNQTDIIEAFNSTSRYLDELLKRTRSVTMNIFRFFSFLSKSFVKIELSYVFTIHMFSTAENCMEK